MIEYKRRAISAEVHYTTLVEMLQLLVHNKNISKEAYDVLFKHLKGAKENAPNWSDFIAEIQQAGEVWEIDPNTRQPIRGHSMYFGPYILKVVPHSINNSTQDTCHSQTAVGIKNQIQNS